MESEKYLQSKGIEFRKLVFQEIPKTAQDVERIYGCSLDQVLKTLVFVGSKKPVVVVLQGTKRINMKKLRHIVGDNKIQLAKPEETHHITGYTIGSVSPFGFTTDVIKILDKQVLHLDTPINIGSGVADIGFEMMPSELQKAWDGIIDDISE